MLIPQTDPEPEMELERMETDERGEHTNEREVHESEEINKDNGAQTYADVVEQPRQEPERWHPLEYIPGITEPINRQLRQLGVRTGMDVRNNVGSTLPNYKRDEKSLGEQTGVVYQFTCDTCQAQYIGSTKRQLQERRTEHKKGYYDPAYLDKSAVTTHSVEEGHAIQWNNPKILDRNSNQWKLRTVEGLHIQKNAPTLNRQQEVNKTSDQYRQLRHLRYGESTYRNNSRRPQQTGWRGGRARR